MILRDPTKGEAGMYWRSARKWGRDHTARAISQLRSLTGIDFTLKLIEQSKHNGLRYQVCVA